MITTLELQTLKHAQENRESSVTLLTKTLEFLGLQPTEFPDTPFDLEAAIVSDRSDLDELREGVTAMINCAFDHALEERNIRLDLRRRQRELQEALNTEI